MVGSCGGGQADTETQELKQIQGDMQLLQWTVLPIKD